MPNVVLVYDGQTFTYPEEMGRPRDDQMLGAPTDRLVEVAGRVSYDSVGRGRPSPDFHENLRAQRHLSVHRHLALTFALYPRDEEAMLYALAALAGRPGVFPTAFDGDRGLRFVCNGQAALQWHERPCLLAEARDFASALGESVRERFDAAAPMAIGLGRGRCDAVECHQVGPETDHEVYASLFLSGVSRACADELLRHTWECAPSVESGRYVDASRRPWVFHPLFRGDGDEMAWCHGVLKKIETHCRAAYGGLVNTLSMLRPEAGVKQCRAAARGVIGMSVSTRLVFTASLAAWREVFRQRISEHADQEIRELAVEIRKALAARWPDRFPEA